MSQSAPTPASLWSEPIRNRSPYCPDGYYVESYDEHGDVVTMGPFATASAARRAVLSLESSEGCEECGRRPAESIDGGMLGERFLCAMHARRACQVGEAF